MRNPMDSWAKSDTDWSKKVNSSGIVDTDAPFEIGKDDLVLAKKLIHGGTEHRKFLRLIQVWAVWELPRYVWTEADTYKVGLTRMSCSTMHKLGTKDLSVNDFQDWEVLQNTLDTLNDLGRQYRETKDYQLVRQMKKILPEGFIQRADVNFNYEVAMNIFRQRYNHRLPEWKLNAEKVNEPSICDWLYELPHFKTLVG
jgi:hypothetical protein